MMNIEKAKKVCMELDALTQGGLKKIRWNDLYADENALVDDLRKVEIPENGEAPCVGFYPLFTGYVYIYSFAKRVQEGQELTEKQMTMAKRLALQIRKASAIVE